MLTKIRPTQALRQSPAPEKNLYHSVLDLAVIIAGLGYFIDTFDFFLALPASFENSSQFIGSQCVEDVIEPD
jgi:hypothetical protein